MLWQEDFKPKSFDEFLSHKEVVSMLKNLTLENIPNLIICGQKGHSKSTIMKCLIKQLYGKYPEMIQKSTEIKINSKPLLVDFLECDEMIQITPSDYGNRDRQVIQSIVKGMAEIKPILGMLGKKKRAIKVIVISEAENLSRDAQAALRRTMEIYTDHFRIIMLCSEASKLIEPIRSRSLFIRVRGFTDEEIILICKSIAEKNQFEVEEKTFSEIALNSKGNCKRAICILELFCFNREAESSKRKKIDLLTFELDWETSISSIVVLIKTPKVENLLKIRKELYSVISSGIDSSEILLEILSGLLTKNFNKNCEIVDLALKFEERMQLGTKPIFHLEAFAANAMRVLSKK